MKKTLRYYVASVIRIGLTKHCILV